MKPLTLALLTTALAAPLSAQDQRERAAHVHGVSTLQIAAEGGTLVLELLSPGADIVGFEHEARSEADLAAVQDAVARLMQAENVVALPEAAGCQLTEAESHLHAGDGEPEDHADEHGHDHSHDHDDHAGDDDQGHSEFHASYTFTCDNPQALNALDFPFFANFPGAERIEAQYVTQAGAGTATLSRDAPILTLE